MSKRLLLGISFILALGLALPSVSSAALVAWWKLDEGSGLTSADAAGGHTLDLATTGPTWVTAGLPPVPSGTTAALDFGGDDDIAIATGYKGITGTGPRSVAMWIQYDSATIPLSGNGCHMFSNGENNAGERFDIKIQQDSGGQAAQAGRVRFEIQTSFVIANTRVDDGAWHHIALTIEPTGTGLFDRAKIYVDGVLDGEDGTWSNQGTANVAINTSVLNDVRLGDSVLATGDRDYNGLMDDVRYYDHTLTAQEVADLVTATGPPAAPSNLSAAAVNSQIITLTWTDNATNETGFEIQRKEGASGTYATIATVGPDTATYSDTGLNPETTYFYQVRATNAAGNSAWSNEANATTPASSLDARNWQRYD